MQFILLETQDGKSILRNLNLIKTKIPGDREGREDDGAIHGNLEKYPEDVKKLKINSIVDVNQNII